MSLDLNNSNNSGLEVEKKETSKNEDQSQGDKKQNKIQKPSKLKRFFKTFTLLFSFGVLGGTVLAFGLYYWASNDLPSFSKITDYRPAQVTTVLARDGSLIGQFYREKRYVISMNEMTKYLPLAFLAVEDSVFYEHPGVNLKAIFRAFLANLHSGGISQGGSTITQQVVKRLMLTPEKSYERKLKEAILAYRLEKQLSKDDILTIYLNQIFLGSNAYGVEAAARTYFGKHASELSIAECAMIAGLPQSPSANNPYRHPENAKKRQEHVLRRMRDLGWISDEQFDQAFYEKLEYKTMPTFMGREGGWYLEEVRRQLIDFFTEEKSAELGFDYGLYGEDVVYEQGLTVYTSMEPVQQLAADAALRKGLLEASKRHGFEGPIQTISLDGMSEFFEDNPFELEELIQGEWQKAVVTAVFDKGAEVKLGDYKGFVSVATMGWARKPNPAYNGRYLADSIKDARKVLNIGDVIWVSLKFPTDREIKKLKNANPLQLALSQNDVSMKKTLPLALQQVPKVQGAMVSMEPKTGDVVAIVGGYEFSYGSEEFNRATQAKRQPGSVFKPFVYSAALDAGFTAGSMTLDAPIMIVDTNAANVWRPQNYGGGFDGPLRFNRALARSRNLSTIRIAQEIGMDTVLDRAREMKLAKEFPLPTLAVSLGALELIPLDVACSYSAFANLGKRPEPRFIQKIVGPFGNTLFEQEPQEEQVISPENAYIMAKLLQGVVQYGTASKLKYLDRPLAGKTGTTNNEVDAWFVGFTPELVTATYIGYDQIESLGRGETGTGAALPIFKYYADEIFDLYPATDFEKPSSIYFRVVDGISLPFKAGTSVETSINAVQVDNVTGSQSAEELLMQDFTME